jgi:hypothetical protein
MLHSDAYTTPTEAVLTTPPTTTSTTTVEVATPASTDAEDRLIT